MQQQIQKQIEEKKLKIDDLQNTINEASNILKKHNVASHSLDAEIRIEAFYLSLSLKQMLSCIKSRRRSKKMEARKLW